MQKAGHCIIDHQPLRFDQPTISWLACPLSIAFFGASFRSFIHLFTCYRKRGIAHFFSQRAARCDLVKTHQGGLRKSLILVLGPSASDLAFGQLHLLKLMSGWKLFRGNGEPLDFAFNSSIACRHQSLTVPGHGFTWSYTGQLCDLPFMPSKTRIPVGWKHHQCRHCLDPEPDTREVTIQAAAGPRSCREIT